MKHLLSHPHNLSSTDSKTASDVPWTRKGMAPPGCHPLTIRGLRHSRTHRGFSQVEVLVASAILMMTVAQSTALFTNSMQATGKAKLRDGLNAAVNADLEQVRYEVTKWALTTTNDGQLAYAPDATSCANGTLAQALLSERSNALPVVSTVDLAGVPMTRGIVQVNRTITVPTDNTNLIAINYTTSTDSPISIKLSTTLTMPAQGWCP